MTLTPAGAELERAEQLLDQATNRVTESGLRAGIQLLKGLARAG